MAVHLPRPGTQIAFHGYTPPLTLQVGVQQGPRPLHVGVRGAQALQGMARKPPRLQACEGYALQAWTRCM